MLEISRDVECVFRIDSNSGLQGQLLKLDKSNGLKIKESLSILLGRLACIGEEWNYNDFHKENWESIFGSENTLSQYIVKEFSKIESHIFDEKITQFLDYFSVKEYQNAASISINHNYSGNYKFDGENIIDYFKNMNVLNEVPKLNLSDLDSYKQKSVYVNEEKWNWQLWFVETKEYHFLFEEVIIT